MKEEKQNERYSRIENNEIILKSPTEKANAIIPALPSPSEQSTESNQGNYLHDMKENAKNEISQVQQSQTLPFNIKSCTQSF